MGRSVLASGTLGQHNGLPATITISTTLKELESGAGQAATAGGSLLPMPDVIRMASHAHHYLVILDNHTVPLYLGRSKRIASTASEWCCTPGPWLHVPWLHRPRRTAARCTSRPTGPRRTDRHHRRDASLRPTQPTRQEGGWTTRKRKDGRTEWIPPPSSTPAKPASTTITVCATTEERGSRCR